MNCPQCTAPIQSGAAFCDNCGASVGGASSAPTQLASLPSSASPSAAQTVLAGTGSASPPAAASMGAHAHPPAASSGGANCPSCSAAVIPGQAFCDDCGASLSAVQPSSSPPAYQASPAPAPAPAPMPQPAYQAQSAPAPAPAYQPPSAPVPPPYQPPAPAAAPSGNTCNTCGAGNAPGQAFCDNCGASLQGGVAVPSQPSAPAPVATPAPMPSSPPASPKTVLYTKSEPKLMLDRDGTTFDLMGKQEALIGREDPVSGIFPEVDLTMHGGIEGGVSRRHAKLMNQGGNWTVEDLNATNYTFVNRKRLMAGQPEPLNEGDKIRVGRVVLTFKTS